MRTQDWFLLVFLSVLWGASFFFVGVAQHEVPPFTLVLARVGLAAAVLLPLVFALGYSMPGSPSAWQPFIVQAAINNVVPFTLMVYGQQRIASGLAAVLNATTPLFTLLIARVFAGEAMTVSESLGVALGIAGVAVLMGPEALTSNASSVIGMLCIIGGCDCLWRIGAVDAAIAAHSTASDICGTADLLYDPVAAAGGGCRSVLAPADARDSCDAGGGGACRGVNRVSLHRVLPHQRDSRPEQRHARHLADPGHGNGARRSNPGRAPDNSASSGRAYHRLWADCH
jgi:hypothetical protein